MIPATLQKFITIKIVILFVIVSVFFAGIFSFLTPKKYKSSATLMIMEPVGDRTINQDAEKIETLVETYSSILHGMDLLNRVIDNLELNKGTKQLTAETLSKMVKVKAVRNTRLIRIEASYKDPEMAAKIAEELAAQCLLVHSNIIQGELKSSRQFFNEQLEKSFEELKKSDKNLSTFQKKAPIQKLQKQLAVALEKMREYDMEYSYLDIEIKKTKALKDKASDQLNTLSRDIVSLRSNVSATSPSNSVAQRQQLKSKLQTLDQEVSELNADEDEIRAKIKSIRDMTARIHTQVEYGNVPKYEVERLEALLNELPRRYLSQIDSSSAPLLESTNGYREKSVTELNPLYQENQREVVNADLFLAQLESKKENLQKLMGKNSAQISSLQNKLADLERENDQHWREVEITSDNYKKLAKKVDEININVAAKIGDIIVVEKPAIPSKASSPNIKMNMAVAGLLALLIGVALLYLKSILPAENERSDS